MNRPSITGISSTNRPLTCPPGTPHGEIWRYGLGFPFQVAPGLAGIVCDIDIECTDNYGFKNGADVILFDDLSNIGTDRVCPVSRNEYSSDLFLKSPVVGGFVPMGAKRPDGSPHPYAGTGFGLGQAHRFPNFDGRNFNWGDSGRRDFIELFQFTYDGGTFTSRLSSSKTQDPEFPMKMRDSEWSIGSYGLTGPIPDGDDLLLPLLARNGNIASDGISRWSFVGDGWIPVSFLPVTGLDDIPLNAANNVAERIRWMEPSLIRDTDGSLLFSARGADDFRENGIKFSRLVQVWRSSDNGASWQVILSTPDIRQMSPVTINRAADGTPYLVSNPYDPAFTIGKKTGRGREFLSLWPLNDDRSGLAAPIPVRDAVRDFGTPPLSPDPEYYNCWMVDHANAATLLLADGKWHNILAYRAKNSPLFTSQAAISPSPYAGCYFDEVLSEGESIPAWNF